MHYRRHKYVHCLFFSFVKRGMRDMITIRQHIDKIRKRVQEKNNEREKFKNKTRYRFDVLHANALPKIMLIKIIKNTNSKNVQSKFETWKYKVVRIKQQEQVHKTKKIQFHNTYEN